jgi:branched-chain amino acid transport system ATP-binding protein
MALLKVNDLAVSYGQIAAVRGVSFSIDEGQVVAIVGANGAGKTTIMNTISGLLHPQRGQISFAGQDITRQPPHRIVAEGIVMVAEGRAILASMSVEENLMLGQAAAGSRMQNGGPTIASVIERFPILAQRRSLPAGQLSGGEQQMLAIARALLASPRLLLMDEPSMGLAPLLVKQVFAIIAELKAEGRTILLVEQNALKALQLADYAYVLERGRIALSGTGKELAGNQDVARAYLGGL